MKTVQFTNYIFVLLKQKDVDNAFPALWKWCFCSQTKAVKCEYRCRQTVMDCVICEHGTVFVLLTSRTCVWCIFNYIWKFFRSWSQLLLKAKPRVFSLISSKGLQKKLHEKSDSLEFCIVILNRQNYLVCSC